MNEIRSLNVEIVFSKKLLESTPEPPLHSHQGIAN